MFLCEDDFLDTEAVSKVLIWFSVCKQCEIKTALITLLVEKIQ